MDCMTDNRKLPFITVISGLVLVYVGFFIGGLSPMLCLRVLEGYLNKVPRKERQ